MDLELLAIISCLWWASAISYTDLRTYRISNWSLVAGLALIWPLLFLLDQKFQITSGLLVTSVVALTAGLASLIGMGDVKLVLLIAPWVHYENIDRALFILVLFSWLQLVVITLIHRRFPQRIAFAPAILLAAALNMAT